MGGDSDSSALTIESGDEGGAPETPRESVVTGTDAGTEYAEDEDAEMRDPSPGKEASLSVQSREDAYQVLLLLMIQLKKRLHGQHAVDHQKQVDLGDGVHQRGGPRRRVARRRGNDDGSRIVIGFLVLCIRFLAILIYLLDVDLPSTLSWIY